MVAVRDHRHRFGDALPVVVTFSDDLALVAAHRRHLDVEFPVLADPDLALYRALGIGRGSVRDVWSPGTLATYARLVGSGHRLRRPTEDTRQLGADAVIDRSGRLVRTWRPSSPDARPPISALIAAVTAGDGPGDWRAAPDTEDDGVVTNPDRMGLDGTNSGDSTTSLARHGLPTDRQFAETWAGFSPEQILDAIDRGFTSGEQFAPWADTDVDIAEVDELAPLESFEFDRATALAQFRNGAAPAEIAFSLESGLKIKKVQAWMRRGLSAATAQQWSSAGFTAKETARWVDVVADPDVARSLVALGFDPAAAGERRPDEGWTPLTVRRHVAGIAGADGDTADAWAATTLPDRKLRAWVRSGIPPAEAVAWRDQGFGPRRAAIWFDLSFSPTEASAWHTADVTPDIAARRRAAGIRPPAT